MKHGNTGEKVVADISAAPCPTPAAPRRQLKFAGAAMALVGALYASQAVGFVFAPPPPPPPAPAWSPPPAWSPAPAPWVDPPSPPSPSKCSTTWAGTQSCTTDTTVIVQSHPPEGLKGIPVPTPSNLSEFVANKSEAIRLGKALFWDMQVGSDGKQACGTCHFHAGADSRHKNQISPGLERRSSPTTPNPDTTFQLGGPNYELKLTDFPLHKLSDPKNASSSVLSSVNDIVGSQGIVKSDFKRVTPGASEDQRVVQPDPVFHVGPTSTRRVTGRNAPTVINAVFNFRNFWDGRAQFIFNGENPFGARDDKARVYKNASAVLGGKIAPVQVRIDNASLASQASGPPGNDVEMSAAGRHFMHIGKRLLTARPLAKQIVSPTDSVLGSSVGAGGRGLKDADYASLVKAAFQPVWWNGGDAVQLDAQGNRTIVAKPNVLGDNQFTQMQANFGLFFSLAVQMYESTLVSDDAPFDRHMAGNASAMTDSQRAGMGLFFSKGKCSNCHGGAEFTNASVRLTKEEPLERMIMGNGGVAVYDEGFYNTGVSKTLEDIINGANDPFGKPLAQVMIARGNTAASFKQLIGIDPNITVGASERVAVNGAAKTPTARNVELTAPYFHNGSAATLRQVVEFYNRGGNFAQNNMADLDADVMPLGLSEAEITQLVDFMMALTDDRVRFEKAPFDHPQLLVPWGHSGDMNKVNVNSQGDVVDVTLEVPATGAAGYDSRRGLTPPNFLSVHYSGNPTVSVVARHSNKCLETKSAATSAGSDLIQNTCASSDAQRFSLMPADDGSLRLVPAGGNKVMEVAGGSAAEGTVIKLASSASTAKRQMWQIVEMDNGYSRIYNRATNLCLTVNGASSADLSALSQSTCSVSQHQQFMLKS